MQSTRKATHAGSWYSNNKQQLQAELDRYLSQVTEFNLQRKLKVLIGPHAGFSYSGPTAAWAYKNIDPNSFRTVFVLGPSHHAYFRGCYLPYSRVYQTPLGDLEVDADIVDSLRRTGIFGVLDKKAEEKEHSIEMHLPLIRKVFLGLQVKVVPVMVGDLDLELAGRYGREFQRYLGEQGNLMVVSSDFCHWGENFDYMPYDRSKGMIYQSIESLDRQGMSLIENHDLAGFKHYLDTTENTICGCNPIMVALSSINQSGLNLKTEFIRYAQSNQVLTEDDFSVSYASSLTYQVD